ncbi:bifunctional 4-hydroxy-2-oxoglutarate aldolase/2-dehydro-3-deoxy-phosphogluconate aldolase [Streptomyces sp. A7024]|uniref:Bifunctional 4-hydroxy-2-oxoglutarate aldolase/2-dehydro-3-deoxy-phosphogluconate aldolase n=1 Tax=Streptomyces coryli TaxID=1128680 RepID=A0A6G4TX39_9ACTN|nr:bifunctional 4-hydroxy-2-oxoglutarate aldolase/2-dehydro-3-deoxy-phosphogluconate aldolase [Streptomyces coryli]NGN64383.1 bifunctional 4-hydroxy-2-oxoglutarate aldolase/2-dehydro-3-deoxy-phosphogluconate aldolase [Streptomyces coryli]
MSDLLSDLERHRILTIFRGQSADQCADLAEALYAAGIRLFEVTLHSGDPLKAIAAIRGRLGADARVGAGTVLTTEDVEQAAGAGAQFVVSPDIDAAVVERTKELGMGSVPGALSPTEVLRAVRAGADAVKVFPVSSVGAGHIRQLRGPLPDVPYVATGGVDESLAEACIEAGCVGVGVGVQLFGDPADTEAVVRGAERFAAATARASRPRS